MSKKKTIEEVKEYALKFNYICLSNYYINSHVKLKFMCPNKHIFEMPSYKFFQGRRCIKCSGSEKYTFNFVEEYIQKFNYTLLSKEYKDSKTLLKLKCSQDHICYISFNKFKNSKIRCPTCSGNSKYDIEFVKKYIHQFEYKLLIEQYINNKTPMKMVCPNGHLCNISLSSFKNLKVRCRTCHIENNLGENHPRWNPNRTIKSRLKYLSFNPYNLDLLKDDPLYIYHIESKLKAKESTNRHSRSSYSVDHIFPRKAFIDNNLDEIYDKKIIKQICNLRENLQIIPNQENITKYSKYDQEEFMNWFNKKIKNFLK